jgi:hypothetical protein
VSLRKGVIVFFEVELTPGTYHVAVRAKFTTVTVWSFDMIGIICDLCTNGSPSGRRCHGCGPINARPRTHSLRRASVAQNPDTLSTEVDIVPPAGRMKHLALERLYSLQVRDARYGKRADGRNEGCRARELLLACAQVARFYAPDVRVSIPLGLVDRRMEPAVGTQSILVHNAPHVLQNFWLCAM